MNKKSGDIREGVDKPTPLTTPGASDEVLVALLERVKIATDSDEIRRLSDQIERVVFHRQFENA